MQRGVTRKVIQYSFWLSLLIHLLFCICVFFVFHPTTEEAKKKPPNLYIPSYVYHGAIKQSVSPQRIQANRANHPKSEPVVKTQPIKTAMTDTGMEYQPRKKTMEHLQSKPISSMLNASMDAIKQNQMDTIRQNLSDEEPILMIGDPNTPADPLIKLMGRSLSAYFRYPEAEGMMGIKGRVLIKLTLSPEGSYSDVMLVRSSDNANLDAAALFAVNRAPRVIGADSYLQKPKRFLIGFVFY